MGMMEKYAYNLEEIVEERTQQLVEEKSREPPGLIGWVQVRRPGDDDSFR